MGGVVVVAPLDLDLERAVALGEGDGGAGPVHCGEFRRVRLQCIHRVLDALVLPEHRAVRVVVHLRWRGEGCTGENGSGRALARERERRLWLRKPWKRYETRSHLP